MSSRASEGSAVLRNYRDLEMRDLGLGTRDLEALCFLRLLAAVRVTSFRRSPPNDPLS
jgi:hypothetical protein